MRVVVDTNVIVSGLMNHDGSPGRVIDALLSGKAVLLYDDRILSEYRQVLPRPKFRLNLSEIDEFLRFVEESGEYFSGQRLDLVLPDATDLVFLEVATASLADALITGNAKHFRPLRGQHAVKVLSPVEFAKTIVV